MIEITKAFEKGNKKAFVAFITAGDPTLNDTRRYLDVLQSSGVDIIEIGIPFSDPIAEDMVMQEADIRALKNGVCIDDIFSMLESVEKKVPFFFTTYANPVFFYGYDKFFRRCREVGVCGVVVPDVPYEENSEIKEVACRYGVQVVDVVAPTSKERIRKVCKEAQGFIYLVPAAGCETGNDTDMADIVQSVRAATNTPVCVWLGVSTPERAAKTAKEADGVIVDSAIVKIIARYGSKADGALSEYVRSVAAAVHAVK